MVLKGSAVDQDIVKEDQDTLSQKRVEGGVHGPLEGCKCPTETERHHSKFKMAEMGLEGRFVFFPTLHSNLMETGIEVQGRKPAGP